MDKKITISLPEELISKLIKEAEDHRETFEDLILRKLKYNDLSFRAPDDFFQKKIIKISIDDLTSESKKQEEFDKLLTNVLEDYFNKTCEDRNKMGEEALRIIRDAKQKKEEKTFNNNKEDDSEFKIPDSIWDEIFKEVANQKPILTEEEIEALNKTLNEKDERALFIPQLKYNKNAYHIIRKIFQKYSDKDENFKKRLLQELKYLKIISARG